jgi:hypothetical protein
MSVLFAGLLSQELGLELATPNLHNLVCVLTDQALHWGNTCGLLELWVERVIQFVKAGVSHRVVRGIEAVITNRLNLLRGLAKFGEGRRSAVLGFNELFPSIRNAHAMEHVEQARSMEDYSHSYLVGKYEELDAGEADLVLQSAYKHIFADGHGTEFAWWSGDKQWYSSAGKRGTAPMLPESAWCSEQLIVRRYSRAVWKGQDVLTSKLYNAAIARDSSHIVATYQEDDGEVEYVGRVNCFVYISPRADQGAGHSRDLDLTVKPVILALVDYYSHRKPLVVVDDKGRDVFGRIYVTGRDDWKSAWALYPTLLGSISGKLCYCTAQVDGKEVCLYAKPTHYSGVLA